MTRTATSVDEVLDLFTRWGSQHYDEALSQTDHALQCAALAAAEGADDAMVAAALLHDVGHLLDMESTEGAASPLLVDMGHEAVGARYLTGVFGPEVTAPIALHVRAKRYLCAVDPGYLSGLSAGSLRSLALQGGPADAAEVARWTELVGFADAVLLRRWDDRGKVEGMDVPDLRRYRPLLERLATRTRPTC